LPEEAYPKALIRNPVETIHMPKRLKLHPHASAEELERRYRKARDPVERSHHQIVWLLSEGKSTREVCEVTGYSPGWVRQIAHRYNERGVEDLGDRRHANPGAASRALLTQAHQQELMEALEAPPEDGGMWSSRKVAEWIERNRQTGGEGTKGLGVPHSAFHGS
jgi:transposase